MAAPLNVAGSATLATVAGVVTGSVTLGPGQNGDRGPATWNVTGVIVKSSRPGVAPIPKVVIYLDTVADGNAQGVSYDGSFDQGATSVSMIRGQRLIAVWSGGSNGDVVTFIISGTKQ